MRISNGPRFHNAFVQYAFLGDEPVGEIWLGDRKLYPSDEERIARLYIDMPDEGSASWCYLQHMIDVLKLAHQESGYAVLEVAGMRYAIGFVHSQLHSVRFEGDCFIFGTDEGPSLHDVAQGGRVAIRMFIPMRNSPQVAGEPAGSSAVLPVLPSTGVFIRLIKNKKKVHAHCEAWITAGEELIWKGESSVYGEKRGDWPYHATTLDQFVARPVLHARMVDQTYHLSSEGFAWLNYPPISQSITATITKIVTQ